MILKKRKDDRLNKYSCNIYLQNALKAIVEKEYDFAYSEICWAIIKSGGELTEKQEKTFKRIIENGGVLSEKDN